MFKNLLKSWKMARNERPAFPGKKFLADLQGRGLTVPEAARRAVTSSQVLHDWIAERRSPSPGKLTAVLEANGIPSELYRLFLESRNRNRLWIRCPSCKGIRRVWRLASQRAEAQREGHLRQLPDGTCEGLCRRCWGHRNREKIKRRRLEFLAKRYGRNKADALYDAAEQGDAEAKEEIREVLIAPLKEWRRAGGVRTPTQAELRRRGFTAMVTHIVRARAPDDVVKQGDAEARKSRLPLLRLCALCQRIVSAPRRARSHGQPLRLKRTWHRPCWRARLSWWRRRMGRLPKRDEVSPLELFPSSRSRGPRPADDLARNYQLLVARHAREKNTLRNIVAKEGLRHRSTVTMAIKSFIARLPGRWDLVFGTSRRETNRIRHHQMIVKLPEALEPLIDRRERDSLITWLHEFGMPEKDIADVTGASPARVRGLTTPAPRPPRSPEERWIASLRRQLPEDGSWIRSGLLHSRIGGKLPRDEFKSILAIMKERGDIELKDYAPGRGPRGVWVRRRSGDVSAAPAEAAGVT